MNVRGGESSYNSSSCFILEAVPNKFQKFVEETEIDKGVDQFHKTVLMRTVTISRLVLEGQVTRRKKYGYFLTPDNCLF